MTPREPDDRRLEKRQARPKPAPGIISATDTSSPQYAHSLQQRESATWKRWLDVQRPYRWNLRRLEPGFLLDVGYGLGRNLAHVDGQGGGCRPQRPFCRHRPPTGAPRLPARRVRGV